MNKKIKAIILTIWFVLSIILNFILSYICQDLLTIGIISLGMSFGLIVCDKDLVNMKLF